jgi:biotin carboxylase
MSAGSPANPSQPLTFLCLASFEKGQRFMQAAKHLGCRVFLLTSESLQHTVYWPLESLEEVFYMPDHEHEWNLQHMLASVSHLCRTISFDRIVPLDDFDVEKAALLREHLRIPGLGESQTRYFRDKLAMRMRAQAFGIPVPPFTDTINFERITHFVDSIQPPWVLKPRLLAGAIGIKKFHHRQDLWDRIHSLGDRQSYFLLERFVPGDIFHVDSIWFEGKVAYAVASRYGTPPLDVTQSGGIFTTQILERGTAEEQALCALNERVLSAFDFSNGVSHTEFIRAHEDGQLYFLETSARVGGANISDLLEAATGINMWAEWAKVEVSAATGKPYTPPQGRTDNAALLISLARQEWPDTSHFAEPELVWRLHKRHHVGFIFKSPDFKRVADLLHLYTLRVREQYYTSAPAKENVAE